MAKKEKITTKEAKRGKKDNFAHKIDYVILQNILEDKKCQVEVKKKH